MDLSLPSSPYAHIFEKGQPKTPWPKLDPNHMLSIHLAKFWGKDLHEEKRQWQEKQTGGNPMNMNANQSDILLADFPLYFGDSWNTSGMWVREDYVLLYDYCTTYFNQPKVRTSVMPPSVAITGQPGIGM